MICWSTYRLHHFPTHLNLSGNQIPVTAPEAASLRHRGPKPDKGASRLTGREFLRPHHTAWMCHDPRPTPLANLATISVNIRLYLLTNRRCLFNDSSSRQYPQLSSRRSLLFRNRRRRHIALPLYLSLEICYVLPDLLSLLFSFFYRVAFFLLCFCFCFALTWISKRSDLSLFLSGSCWRSDERGKVYVLGAFCRVPKRYASAGELFRWWRWWRLVFILPFPASGADEFGYTGSHGTKRRRCVDYVLSKNFLFALRCFESFVPFIQCICLCDYRISCIYLTCIIG